MDKVDNSVDKFPYFFAKIPISAPFLPVKTQNRISFYPCTGSFIAPKRSAWQIVAEIFRRNRFFCEIGISVCLEKHCSNDAFYRKTAVSPTGTAVPEKQGIRVRLRAARSFYIPLHDKRKRKKRQPVKDFPKAAPLRAGGRSQGFPFSFGCAPILSNGEDSAKKKRRRYADSRKFA